MKSVFLLFVSFCVCIKCQSYITLDCSEPNLIKIDSNIFTVHKVTLANIAIYRLNSINDIKSFFVDQSQLPLTVPISTPDASYQVILNVMYHGGMDSLE